MESVTVCCEPKTPNGFVGEAVATVAAGLAVVAKVAPKNEVVVVVDDPPKSDVPGVAPKALL